MIKLCTFFIFITNSLIYADSLSHENILSEKEKNDGWFLLFNGKDMSEWREYKKKTISPHWTVTSGCISLTGKGARSLISKNKFGSFEELAASNTRSRYTNRS
jgi:hypothetical protein